MDETNLVRAIERIDEHHIITNNGRIRPGYLILLNGKDVRLYGELLLLKESDIVEVIPVNHGG